MTHADVSTRETGRGELRPRHNFPMPWWRPCLLPKSLHILHTLYAMHTQYNTHDVHTLSNMEQFHMCNSAKYPPWQHSLWNHRKPTAHQVYNYHNPSSVWLQLFPIQIHNKRLYWSAVVYHTSKLSQGWWLSNYLTDWLTDWLSMHVCTELMA